MKPLLFLCLLVVWGNTAFTQTGVLTGSVFDAESKTPLELATISILGEDSSIISYKLADKYGKFLFDKLPLKRKLQVNISYTGYTTHHATVELTAGKKDTLNVLLAINDHDSNTVVVTAAIPIRMNGDTLEINPAAFKMKEDAVVEELLNQVPGITIWSDGTITVNGQKVQNLLVDGKPFLGSSDTRVATQNLPKTAIDKIQLYQEYDRSNISQQTQTQDSLLTMNIRLKEGSKKGYFGKTGAGYGTVDRFESDISFQVYNKRSSAGIGGGFNNINKSIGNLQEIFQNSTYRNFNPNLYNVGRFGASGINKNHSIGAIVSHNFNETTNSRQNDRIAVNYNKSGISTSITDLVLQSRTTINNPQFIREEGEQNNISNKHDVGINYVKTNSYNDNLNVNGAIGTNSETGTSSRFTQVRDSLNQLQSTNTSATVHKRQSNTETLNVTFAKTDRENPIKGFNAQFNSSRNSSSSVRDVTSDFESFVDLSKNALYNRQYATKNNSLNINGNLDYTGFKRLLLGRFNMFGIGMSFTQRINYIKNEDNNLVSDFDSLSGKQILNNSLTNRNKRALFEYAPALALSKSFNKFSDIFYRNVHAQVSFVNELKTDKNTSTLAKRNLERSFNFFRYNANINYNYTKQRKFQYYMSLNYAKSFDYATLDQLYTIVDDINVYNTTVGNPFLRNRINHNLNFNSSFNTQKPEAVYSVNGSLGGGYTRSLNPVADSTINDPSGRRIIYYINADESNNMYVNYRFNISRKINKNNLQLMYDGRYGSGKYPGYIDGLYNVSGTASLTNNLSLQYSLASILVLNLGQSFQRYSTKQTGSGLQSFSNNNNSTKFGAVLNYPENFTFSSTVDYIDNSNLNEPTILFNTFATYRFMKQQAEFKLTAMDILKQYQNISNSVGSYGTTTKITNGLQQYFLFTFSYYPRKFGKTETKRQGRRSMDY